MTPVHVYKHRHMFICTISWWRIAKWNGLLMQHMQLICRLSHTVWTRFSCALFCSVTPYFLVGWRDFFYPFTIASLWMLKCKGHGNPEKHAYRCWTATNSTESILFINLWIQLYKLIKWHDTRCHSTHDSLPWSHYGANTVTRGPMVVDGITAPAKCGLHDIGRRLTSQWWLTHECHSVFNHRHCWWCVCVCVGGWWLGLDGSRWVDVGVTKQCV